MRKKQAEARTLAENELLTSAFAVSANHACAVVAAVRSGLKNGVCFRLMSVKLISEESYSAFMARGVSDRYRDFKAAEKWFRFLYNTRRLCNMKVVLPVSLEDRTTPCIIAFYEDGSRTTFLPEWKQLPDSCTYTVRYTEQPQTSELSVPRYEDNSAELGTALRRASDFAGALGLTRETAFALCGTEELEGHAAGWSAYESDGAGLVDRIRRPRLPEKTSHIYAAATRSPTATSDWYERVSAAAAEQGKADEFAAIMDELTRCQRLAMLYCVNES